MKTEPGSCMQDNWKIMLIIIAIFWGIIIFPLWLVLRTVTASAGPHVMKVEEPDPVCDPACIPVWDHSEAWKGLPYSPTCFTTDKIYAVLFVPKSDYSSFRSLYDFSCEKVFYESIFFQSEESAHDYLRRHKAQSSYLLRIDTGTWQEVKQTEKPVVEERPERFTVELLAVDKKK